ncbi:hypothetical protein DPEC_G00339490 [Dallia pectoralis]|uniref:Uncharacterized protein n=1 Tax=Dallia pectoralis TaxID=75939 RepID=A0ACC2F4T7_DALPE|nr:hypothetical protein DPEC_G00339490 [Dallia pectoralis]
MFFQENVSSGRTSKRVKTFHHSAEQPDNREMARQGRRGARLQKTRQAGGIIMIGGTGNVGERRFQREEQRPFFSLQTPAKPRVRHFKEITSTSAGQSRWRVPTGTLTQLLSDACVCTKWGRRWCDAEQRDGETQEVQRRECCLLDLYVPRASLGTGLTDRVAL